MNRSVAPWIMVLALAGCAPSGLVEAQARSSGPGLPASFTALGTEPFWAAQVDGAILVYQTPEDQAGKRVAVSRRADGNKTELAGVLGGEALVLTVRAGTCSDGMSDTSYSHIAELRIGERLLNGCVKLR